MDEVRDAIANGQLVNYYQPKVAVATGEVVGVEALVRWRHPAHGMVFPDQFIGVAEAHGLIDDLTRVVLTGALAQAKAWQQAGLVLVVAVNVSMDNLFSRHSPERDGLSWAVARGSTNDQRTTTNEPPAVPSR